MELKQVDEVADVISGFAFKSSWFGKGTDNVIRIGDIQNGKVLTDQCKCIESNKHNVPENCIAQKDDILMALSGATTGKIGIVDEQSQGSYVNQRVAIIRGKDEVTSRYLRYVFSGNYLNKLLGFAGGAAQANLSPKDLRKLNIPLPSLDKRKYIASILDKASAVIRKRQQAIELSEQLVRSVFLEMFGDPVKNSGNWKTFTLDKITTKIGSGATPRGGEASYKTSGITLIRSMNVYDYRFSMGGLAYIDSKQADGLKNVTVNKEDLLLNITGASVARLTIVPEEILPARVNQHVAIIRPDTDELDPYYAMCCMNSKNYKLKLLKLATQGGSTREGLTKDTISKLEIPVPPLKDQIKFSDFYKKSAANIRSQISASELDAELFSSLTQKAFRGELMH